jgi:hypothetical protein
MIKQLKASFYDRSDADINLYTIDSFYKLLEGGI